MKKMAGSRWRDCSDCTDDGMSPYFDCKVGRGQHPVEISYFNDGVLHVGDETLTFAEVVELRDVLQGWLDMMAIASRCTELRQAGKDARV